MSDKSPGPTAPASIRMESGAPDLVLRSGPLKLVSACLRQFAQEADWIGRSALHTASIFPAARDQSPLSEVFLGYDLVVTQLFLKVRAIRCP